MCNIVRKILLGKLVRFFPKHPLFIIVGVRKSPYGKDYGYEILVARYHEKSKEAEVYSWYSYYDLVFDGRSPKEHIRKCLKRNPDKIKYHIGKSVPLNEVRIYDNKHTKEYAKYMKQNFNVIV